MKFHRQLKQCENLSNVWPIGYFLEIPKIKHLFYQ